MAADRPGFRPDIEGLRGIAILLVVAFHAGVSGLAGGFVGVDVFFVLSGYLITGILAREVLSTGDVNLAEFYARRARRLLPAFLVVLIATLAAAVFLYAPIDAPSIASDGRAVALHYGNVLFATQAVNYHATASNPFLHTWSLAVEEQFYFIWPLLFMLIGRFANGSETGTTKKMIRVTAAAAVLSFAASLVVTRVAQPWAFFGMPTRIWEFAIGGFAALTVGMTPASPGRRTAGLQIAGLVAVSIATIVFHDALPYPGFAALLPALGAVALIAGGHRSPDSFVSRWLGAPVLQWLGKISYSWYLWHWPLVGIGTAIDWQIGVAGKLAWSAAALVLAVLTHRFVEEPVRRSEFLRDEPQRVNLAAIGASVAVALMAVLTLTFATSRASSREQRTFAHARRDNMEHACWGSLRENATAPCVFGDVNASTRVVLMGDSHAEHWLPAMDRVGRERHWKIYAMVKPACPVADMPDMISSSLRRPYTECTEWRREKLRRIVAMHPSLVVLSSYDHYVSGKGETSSWGVTPAIWGSGLRRTYGLLSRAGIKTVAIRDVPDVGFDAPACLSRRASGAPFQVRSCDYELASGLVPSAVAAQTEAARRLFNVSIISMNDRVCSRPICAVVQRGTIVFRDDDHLTAAFSVAEASVLGARVAAAAGLGKR